jgi:hypothetical protein
MIRWARASVPNIRKRHPSNASCAAFGVLDSPEGHSVYVDSSSRVKEDLKRAEEDLTEQKKREDGFQRGRNIRDKPLYSKRLVMGRMMCLGGSPTWNASGKACKDSKDSLGSQRVNERPLCD